MRLLKTILLTLLVLLPLGVSCQRNHVDSLFVKGNEFYERQQYAEAANMYTRILDQGFAHTDLYYNLGNAYYRLGWLGEAIWAYEKGLQLNPGDGDLRFNRKVANAGIVDRVEAPEPFFLLEWYGAFKKRFSPAQWLGIISLVFFFSGAGFSLSRFTASPVRNLFGRVSAFGVAVTVMMTLVFADRYFEVLKKEEAIVVSREANVYSAPSEISNLTFLVHEGTKAEIKGFQEPWLEIELIDGKRGWIRSKEIEPL